jgi:enterochelin esterase-like enzyme
MEFKLHTLVSSIAILMLVLVAALPPGAHAQPVAAESGMCQALVSPKLEVLTAKLSKAGAKGAPKVVNDFISENRGHFPLIEDSLVTFVYSGKVVLRACVPSDLNGWDSRADEMQRMGEADLCYRTLKLPLDARIDYKFYVDNAWMLDPLNAKTVRGGFGDNSAFSMPAYVEPWEIAPADTAKRGKVEEHQFQSKIMGNTRTIRVYLPVGWSEAGSDAGKTGRRAVFVQDGGEYITLGSMVNVLDNLISRGLVPPVVAIFVDPVDRNYEYYLNATYARMLVEEIVPFVRERYGVARDPAMTAIMGASLGGEISVMIAKDHADIFGKCGSQSGAFGVEEGLLVSLIKKSGKKHVDFYLDCGTFEELLESNRQMRDALTEKGYHLRYQEFDEGHSWGNWRAHIDDMLVFFWGQ